MGRGGLEYQQSMGTIVEGIPQHTRYERELDEALAALPEPDPLRICSSPEPRLAVDLGCGIGVYAPMLIRRGYTYIGVDKERFAVNWTHGAFGVCTCLCSVEDFLYEQGKEYERSCQLVIAAHVVEHLAEGPAVFKGIHKILRVGGRAIVVVPDDEDPVNPDHLWFFTQRGLVAAMEACGFVNVQTSVFRRISRESFIYASGYVQ